MSNYYCPVKSVFGIDCINDLINEIKTLESQNILVVIGNKSVHKIKSQITEALGNREYVEISAIKSNPDISDIFMHLAEIKGFEPNCIIAIGGGSVIDTAKILKALLSADVKSTDELRTVVIKNNYTPINCKMILAPTTAGTGSEVTRWATLWDKQKLKKYSLEHELLYADKVYIDPRLTFDMPLGQAVSCALDAFSHAIESYWSPKSCAVSREYSLSAISLFMENIGGLFDFKNNDARENMALSSHFAGLAFSHTKTTVCHAISYPLTLSYNIPHGVAACLTIPSMLEVNNNELPQKDKLYKALNVNAPLELKQLLDKIFISAGFPIYLSEYGVSAVDIEDIASKSFAPGRVDNNPVVVNIDIIKQILNTNLHPIKQ